MTRAFAALVLLIAIPASAEPAQVQADVGLAVVGIGYEQPIGEHAAVMAEGHIFGTYFLPWFDAGTNVAGGGGQLRATWFRRASHLGLYVMGFGRVDRVTHDDDSAVGFCAGAAAGWAFGLTRSLDLRIGAGGQYMRYQGGAIDIDTPFLQLDLVVGYRL